MLLVRDNILVLIICAVIILWRRFGEKCSLNFQGDGITSRWRPAMIKDADAVRVLSSLRPLTVLNCLTTEMGLTCDYELSVKCVTVRNNIVSGTALFNKQ